MGFELSVHLSIYLSIYLSFYLAMRSQMAILKSKLVARGV